MGGRVALDSCECCERMELTVQLKFDVEKVQFCRRKVFFCRALSKNPSLVVPANSSPNVV